MSDEIKRPTIGTWNHLECTIGQRGEGKSTYQCQRALELSREARGAYVIGHSLGARLPTKLPASMGGETLPITYHETIAKLERGLRTKPDRWHVLAPPLNKSERETADDLLMFVTRFSDTLRKAAWKKKHPWSFWKSTVSYEDVECVPIIVLIDEGIAIEAAGSSRKDSNRWFLELIYSLRHYHTALLYSIQDASARSWRILEQANEIVVFRVRHAWALQSIQAAGATPEEVDEIRGLKKYEYVKLEFKAPTTARHPADQVG